MVLATDGFSNKNSCNFSFIVDSTTVLTRGHQLILGLRGEFRIGHFYRQNRRQTFARIVAGGTDFLFFASLRLRCIGSAYASMRL